MTSNIFPVTKYASEAVVALNGQLSGAVDLGEPNFCGVQSPAAITGTQMTFEISNDNVTFTELIDPDTGTAYTIYIAAGKYTPVKLLYFYGIRYIKAKCATAQAAARTFNLLSAM